MTEQNSNKWTKDTLRHAGVSHKLNLVTIVGVVSEIWFAQETRFNMLIQCHIIAPPFHTTTEHTDYITLTYRTYRKFITSMCPYSSGYDQPVMNHNILRRCVNQEHSFGCVCCFRLINVRIQNRHIQMRLVYHHIKDYVTAKHALISTSVATGIPLKYLVNTLALKLRSLCRQVISIDNID